MDPLPPDPLETGRLRLVLLPVGVFEAMATGDLAAARRLAGLPLPNAWPELLPWAIWVGDLNARGALRHRWAARAGVLTSSGEVAVNAGFHGPPDEHGAVEIGYRVEPAWRGRGLAVEAAEALLRWASVEPGVRALRAATDPANAASQGVLRRLGFTHVGDQRDEVHGLEWVWERPPFGTEPAGSP